jgi:hypothetical protein
VAATPAAAFASMTAFDAAKAFAITNCETPAKIIVRINAREFI